MAVGDPEWAARQEEANRRELARLEGELRGYKHNLIRESIRMGQEDLAMHLLATGGPSPNDTSPAGYAAAYQAFGKMRDYCTTPTHINGLTLRLVYTALIQGVAAQQAGGAPASNWSSVLANAGRLRATGVREEEQAKLTPISHVTSGLAQLALGAYREAATVFLRTPVNYHRLGPVHGIDPERSIATANDVAVYGGLCALATLDRDALATTVLGGDFRQFLEQEPHVRKAIGYYTTAKYRACIDLLRRYYSDWSLDIFLGSPAGPGATVSHLDRLLARIRERSITAHFASFSRVRLDALAATFPPPNSAPNAMEAEARALIESGTLDARLDAVDGALVAPHTDNRRRTHNDAVRAADEIERTLLLRLHKVNLTIAGLEVSKPTPTGWVGNGEY